MRNPLSAKNIKPAKKKNATSIGRITSGFGALLMRKLNPNAYIPNTVSKAAWMNLFILLNIDE